MIYVILYPVSFVAQKFSVLGQKSQETMREILVIVRVSHPATFRSLYPL